MTKDEKQLLLKDLCSRLTCGVMVNIKSRYEDVFFDIKLNGYHLFQGPYNIEEMGIRPYLRPMSSMTEEEKAQIRYMNDCECTEWEMCDYLNSRHLDYRGLIPMNLALLAPKGMYNIY